MTNPIGLYIIIESDLDNGAVDRAVNHIQKTQPRDVIIASGGQYDRAMQLCERLRAIAPKTRLTYRHYPNDGALKLFGYNAALLYASHVKPLVPWLKQHNIIFHLDNESVEDDMHQYSDTTARCIEMADADGIGLATASFATGNIPENKYHHLDSMWQALAKSPRSCWCPHEYINTTPQGSAGHVYRFKNGWKRCDELKIKHPATVIQEYGLLINYDPEAGWRRTSMNGAAYAKELISYYESWYKPDDVSVCTYAFCGMDEKNSKWKDCSVDDPGYLKAIEAYKPEPVVITPPPVIGPTPPEIPPAPPPAPVDIRLLVAAAYRHAAEALMALATAIELEAKMNTPSLKIATSELDVLIEKVMNDVA